MIKTVIFDIGNVVVYFDHIKMVNQVSKLLEVPYQEINKRLFAEEILAQFETGALTTDEVFQSIIKLSSLTPDRRVLLAAFNEIFKENESLAPIIHTLKKQGMKLLLLSNISEVHFNYVYQTFPIFRLFDTAILSYQVGHAKPSPEIFEAVLKASGAKPHECFYIDDILGHVNGAKVFGIDAEQFLSSELLIQHLAKRMVFV
jgi:HAD superfamily hydrolase (TIGR01509 family)